MLIKNCGICEKEFEDTSFSKNKMYCSKTCNNINKINKQYENKQEGIDYVRCPECKRPMSQITFGHAKTHGAKTFEEFKLKHNLVNYNSKTFSESRRGENSNLHKNNKNK